MSCFYIVNSIDERSIKIDAVCSQLDSQETETCFHGGRCSSVFHTINTRPVIYLTGCLRVSTGTFRDCTFHLVLLVPTRICVCILYISLFLLSLIWTSFHCHWNAGQLLNVCIKMNQNEVHFTPNPMIYLWAQLAFFTLFSLFD